MDETVLGSLPQDEFRIYRQLDLVTAGPDHGPVHSLVESATEIGFSRSYEPEGWMRAGLPRMRLMTEPTQHFRSAVFEVWHDNVSAEFCNRQGFR